MRAGGRAAGGIRLRCWVGKTVVARSVYRWFRVLCSITSGSPLLRYNIYCISIVNTNQAQLMIVYKASNVCILLTFVSAIFSPPTVYLLL